MKITLKYAKNAIRKVMEIKESKPEPCPEETKQKQITIIKNVADNIENENIWDSIIKLESAIEKLRNNYSQNKEYQLLDLMTDLMGINDSDKPLTDLKVYECGIENSTDSIRVKWREEENKQKPIRIIGATEILGIDPSRRDCRHLIEISKSQFERFNQCAKLLWEDNSYKEDILKGYSIKDETYRVFISRKTEQIFIEYGEYSETFLKEEN